MAVYLWIALGSALGGVSRHALATAVAHHWGEDFPWGTLVVNVTGSLLIGFIATMTGPDGRLLFGTSSRAFLMAGLLGGFTTFSSFSLQTLALARDGDWLRAGLNVIGSVTLCLLAVWLGHLAALALNAWRAS
jgi:fluoride exporter